MTDEKRKTAKADLFCFYVGRPMDYVISIPLIYMDVAPNTITWLSIIPAIIGFILLSVGKTTTTLIWGWACFFIWSKMDGIDGTLARYKEQYTKLGDTLDAAVGYFAISVFFLASGVAAAHRPGILQNTGLFGNEFYIVAGGLSAIWIILPRLILQKAINSTGEKEVGGLKDKGNYGIIELIALNISSVPGCGQLFLLLSILLGILDLFTLAYFVFNTMLMVFSMWKLFRQ